MTRAFSIIVILVVLLAGLMLASLNQHSTTLNYVVGVAELNVSELAAIFLLVGFVLGFGLTLLISFFRKTRRWLNNSNEQR